MNIEFEITLRCNATCHSCSRHTQLYGAESDVTMQQTVRFIEEVKRHGNVDLISIMGGEPTVHPEFKPIVYVVKQALLARGFIKRLQIVTNGNIPTDPVLGVPVVVSPESVKSKEHRCMYVAPYDTGQKLKKCTVPRDCGVSFGAYGWYPCGAGGAISRLFGKKLFNRQTIPKDSHEWHETSMCKLCQAHAEKYMFVKDYGDIESVSFRKAFAEFDSSNLRKY